MPGHPQGWAGGQQAQLGLLAQQFPPFAFLRGQQLLSQLCVSEGCHAALT